MRPKRWLNEDLARVNPSGGTLAGTPQTTSGLARAAEAALQLRGEAGARQIKGARAPRSWNNRTGRPAAHGDRVWRVGRLEP